MISLKNKLGAWNLKAPIAFKTALDQEQLGAFIIFAIPSLLTQNDLVSLFYYSKKNPEVSHDLEGNYGELSTVSQDHSGFTETCDFNPNPDRYHCHLPF